MTAEAERPPLLELWRAPRFWQVWVGFEIVFGLVSVLIALHEGKSITSDMTNYEFYSGYGLLHGFGTPYSLAGDLQTYTDASLNVVYYVLVAHTPPWFVTTAIALLQSLSLATVAVLVWRYSANRMGPAGALAAGAIAGGAALVAPNYISELGSTMSDTVLTLGTVVAVALLYRVLQREQRSSSDVRDVILAAVVLGLTSGLKYTNAPYAVAVVFAFAAAVLFAPAGNRWTARQRLRVLGTLVAVILAVAVIINLPTEILLWRWYRDPIFPYMNGLFHSPYLLSGDWSDVRWVARSPLSLWQHTIRLIVGGAARHNGLSEEQVRSPALFVGLVITTVLFAVDLAKRRRAEAIFLELSVLLGFVLWAVAFGYYRYLAPLEMVIPAGSLVLIIGHMQSPKRSARILLTGVAALLALSASVSRYQNWGHSSLSGSYFDVRASEFASIRSTEVVIADGSLGFVVPYLPNNHDIVRIGGNLLEVMSNKWWSMVTKQLRHHHSLALLFPAQKVDTLLGDMANLGVAVSVHSCRVVKTPFVHVGICFASVDNGAATSRGVPGRSGAIDYGMIGGPARTWPLWRRYE
jgi:hypothetical protein